MTGGWNHSWFLGTVRGIPIIVHWSFLLILAWSGYQGYRIGGWSFTFFSVLLTLLLFGCVVLHELGHSLAARCFGIHTRHITLLPIGGVAALDRIPERPAQEMVIAVAGPLVNAVIVSILYLFIGWPDDPFILSGGWNPSLLLSMLFYVNMMMIVFNLIPAFPMDGGRVLRALLAMFLPYERATAVASVVGQCLAVGMMVFGVYWNPFLSLIGVLVFMGARQEHRMVRNRAAVLRGWSSVRRPFIDLG